MDVTFPSHRGDVDVVYCRRQLERRETIIVIGVL
jgi:hypothetical protein